MEQLRGHFKPEFLNRIDEVILFRRLSLDHIKHIIKIQLDGLKKMLADRKITLTLEASAEELLAKAGYDPVYGARPLKRAIQSLVQNPLAMKLLGGAIKPGDAVVVKGDLATGQMVFEGEAGKAANG